MGYHKHRETNMNAKATTTTSTGTRALTQDGHKLSLTTPTLGTIQLPVEEAYEMALSVIDAFEQYVDRNSKTAPAKVVIPPPAAAIEVKPDATPVVPMLAPAKVLEGEATGATLMDLAKAAIAKSGRGLTIAEIWGEIGASISTTGKTPKDTLKAKLYTAARRGVEIVRNGNQFSLVR